MNENPEGTPNPLNPTQGAAPTGSVPGVEQPMPAEQPLPAEEPVAEQAAGPEMTETTVTPVAGPVAEPGPIVEEFKSESVTVESEATPEAKSEPKSEPALAEAAVALETMEAVADHGVTREPELRSPEVEPKQKSKKAGIIVAIILLIIAIVAGVAAVLVILNPFAKAQDAVPAAISKLLSGDIPSNVAMNGTINLSMNDSSSQFNSLSIDFESGINNVNTESYVNAKVAAMFQGGGEFNFNIDEIHTADDELYLKLSNVYTELGNYYNNDQQRDLTITPEPIDVSESLSDYLGVFDVIDDEWIYIPGGTFSSLSDLTAVGTPTQCLIDAAGKLGQFGGDFANTYKQYPFVNYSTEDIAIKNKGNAVYRLTFDSDKLASFINSMSNSGFANEMLACVGGMATNVDIDAEALSTIITELPTIYVEIDDNNNFTRVYLSLSDQNGLYSVVADISLLYPAEIKITEPSVYIDFNQALSNVMSAFLQQPITSETIIDFDVDSSSDSN